MLVKPNISYKEALQHLNVSRETSEQAQSKMLEYEKLLAQWQSRVNLVSPTTINDMRLRHFIDSLQIVPLLQEPTVVVDMGSGAGFPALPCAVALDNVRFYCIERDRKKCIFLEEVVRGLGLTNVKVLNEDVSAARIGQSNDVCFTSRALSSAKQLLSFAQSFVKNNNVANYRLVFHKGKGYTSELRDLNLGSKDYFLHDSITENNAKIVEIVKWQK